MSTWRRKALELFYDIRFTFLYRDASIYSLIFELRRKVVQSHKDNDIEYLDKIYNYAEWCFNQEKRSYYIWNAICVGFYEHLVEDEIVRHAIPYRIRPYIFEQVQPLLKWRLEKNEEVYKELMQQYNKTNNTNFEC